MPDVDNKIAFAGIGQAKPFNGDVPGTLQYDGRGIQRPSQFPVFGIARPLRGLTLRFFSNCQSILTVWAVNCLGQYKCQIYLTALRTLVTNGR